MCRQYIAMLSHNILMLVCDNIMMREKNALFWTGKLLYKQISFSFAGNFFNSIVCCAKFVVCQSYEFLYLGFQIFFMGCSYELGKHV